MATLPPIHPNQAPRTSSIGGIPVREDVLFTNANGNEKPALRKQAETAIEKLKAVLPRLLEPGETLLYIAGAVAPLTVLEQLTLGWYAMHLKGVILVLTDRRLLRFRRKNKGWRDWQWNRGVQAARWSDMAEIKVRGWPTRMLKIQYRSGKKETYRITGMRDGKKVRVLVDALFPQGTVAAGAPTGQEKVSLCPECVKPLTPQVYQCPGCGLAFKNEKTLLWRNFLIPGGGYFYTGWTGLGLLQILPDVALVLAVLSLGLVALHFMPPPAPDPGEKAITAADAGIEAVIAAFLFLFENLVSWMHTRRLVREFIPER